MKVVEETRRWVEQVVIGCNFCPFAARELKLDRVLFQVYEGFSWKSFFADFLAQCELLDRESQVETLLWIVPVGLEDFDDYLDALAEAERALKKQGYEGTYQVASFHPEYRFAESSPDDPANYTNRSPYPVFHLLREASLEQVLAQFAEAEKIPENNIKWTRGQGLEAMRALFFSVFEPA